MDNEQYSLVKENYFLKPGFIFLTAKATDISAVLGSCVSVCIYDKVLKTGGMSHFQFPVISDKQKATAVYGNISTYALINMMANEGSELNHLEAQIFGGAFNPEICSKNIGKDNIGVAKRILTKKQIRIVSMDAGGEKGRKVVAAIVYQINKKTGVTYAYESISYWDKEKRQSRAKRKCIGRVDPETKKIIPTHKKQQQPTGIKTKQGPVPITVPDRKFYGATYLFDRIGENTGIIDDLKTCFPDSYRQILSIAYFLIMEDKNPLSRFPRWANLHRHPYGDVITSQRSSELFASITEEAKQNFFRLQAKRRIEKEYLAYDTTSISSYSQCLKQVRYGKNKDHDPLPQINLALLFGQQSRLPFYYRKLPGNINDVKTIKKLLADMNTLGYEKVKVVLDRGFFSAANINGLYNQHMKFLIAAKLSLKIVKEQLDSVRGEATKRQLELYTKLGVDPPVSLQ